LRSGICAIGSFVAGTVSTLIIAALGAPADQNAFAVRAGGLLLVEVLGLVFAVVLASGSVPKAIA